MKGLPPEMKGVWINRAILTNPDLSLAEKFIIAEVDALTTEIGPCRASNSHFAALIGFSTGGIHNLLTQMQKEGKLVQLGFKRTFRERVVNPIFSEHPEIVKQWIEKQTHVSKKKDERKHGDNGLRTHLGISPSSHLWISPEDSSTHPGISRGLIWGLVEDSSGGEREVPSEKTIEKSSSSSSHERSTVSCSTTETGIDDDEIAVASKNRNNGKEALASVHECNVQQLVDIVGIKPRSKAEELARDHPACIPDVVRCFRYCQDHGIEHEVGWFIGAILADGDWKWPKGFQTCAEMAEQEARRAKEKEWQEKEDVRREKEDEENELADAELAKLTKSESDEVEELVEKMGTRRGLPSYWAEEENRRIWVKEKKLGILPPGTTDNLIRAAAAAKEQSDRETAAANKHFKKARELLRDEVPCSAPSSTSTDSLAVKNARFMEEKKEITAKWST